MLQGIGQAAIGLARRSCFCQVLPANGQAKTMTNDQAGSRRAAWLGLVLRDVHFWVPLMVLAGGLLVLRWIS